jgi:hypothetical protein
VKDPDSRKLLPRLSKQFRPSQLSFAKQFPYSIEYDFSLFFVLYLSNTKRSEHDRQVWWTLNMDAINYKFLGVLLLKYAYSCRKKDAINLYLIIKELRFLPKFSSNLL